MGICILHENPIYKVTDKKYKQKRNPAFNMAYTSILIRPQVTWPE